jgi:hypothetical protein
MRHSRFRSPPPEFFVERAFPHPYPSPTRERERPRVTRALWNLV